MSMYRDLLAVAVDEQSGIQAGPVSSGAALSAVQAARKQIGDRDPASNSVYETMAGELKYDAALLSLAWSLDLDFSLASFDQPRLARTRLEAILTESGVGLDCQSSDLP
jgi:hypothetical protein